MDKCPSDFISLVKICVLIQSLELILERGGLVERENPVVQNYNYAWTCMSYSDVCPFGFKVEK